MFETMEQTVLYKLRYTPVSDFLRGKLTGRLDLRRPLEEAALPIPVKQLILRVVGRTRLWRLEKLDVMTELIAHFTDGIASGVSAEALSKAFGDEAHAAKLIARAKRRNRPLQWQALRVAAWPMAALLLFYCGFAVYFFAGRPSPRVDYVAVLNRAIEATPEEDRAWPFYRRALLGLEPDWRQQLPARGFADSRPGSERWLELLEFTKQHQAELEMIRQGGERPALGFVLGVGGSAYDPELWPEQKPPSVDVSRQELATVGLPSLRSLFNIAAMLSADASLAREAHDGKRLLRDIHSLLGLSRQLGKGALLLGMVSLSAYERALDEIDRTLREDPMLIRSDDWIALAHQLSAAQVAGDLITLEFERMSFEDIVQRSFTDDGAGNGRLTPQGVTYMTGLFLPRGRNNWLKEALHPAAGLLVASREEVAEEHARVASRAAGNLMLPRREADWQGLLEELNRSHRPIFESINLWRIPLWGLASAGQHSQEAVERQLGHRDGLLVGIALEIFRREHGRYPDTLDVLVLQLLPAVPADRITGEPVRYRLNNNRPLVYSVGADRNDDGGRPTARPRAAANWDAKPDPMPDGDWILYPAAH
jgi:hypothetical protein